MVQSHIPTSHLAIFLPSLDGGGAERVMVTLANEAAIRGCRVDLVLCSAKGHYLKSVSDKVRVIDLKVSRVIASIGKLALYLRREKPNSLLSAMSHANVAASMAKWMAQSATHLVVSERSTISIEAKRDTRMSARLVYQLVPWAYKKADAIIAVSNAVARDLENFAKFPPETVCTVYNPFDLTRIERLAKSIPAHPWFEEHGRPIVLGVGRLTAQKDFETLIRAFCAVQKSHNARLMILGDGDLRHELTKLIQSVGLSEDDVVMPGFVENPFCYMAHASLFVLSSVWEGLPGVLIEAMACGTPVVSTNCESGPEEILEDGKWGRLVPVSNVGAMSDAMNATLLDAKEGRLPNVQMRAKMFDKQAAVSKYLQLLNISDTEFQKL